VSSPLGYDPSQASTLLAQAGWRCDPMPCQKAFAVVSGTTGTMMTRTLAFQLTTSEREPRNVVSQMIQRQLAAVGFAVDVEIVFGAGTHSRLFAPYEAGGLLLTRKFDAALYQIATPNPAEGAETAAGQFSCAAIPTAASHDTSMGNASGFCDPEVDTLLAAGANGEDAILAAPSGGDALAQALDKIQRAAPVIPLYEAKQAEFVRGLTGVRPAAFLPVTWNVWEWRLSP